MLKLLNVKLLSLASLALLVAQGAFAWGGFVSIVFNPKNPEAYYSYAGSNSRYDAEYNAVLGLDPAESGLATTAQPADVDSLVKLLEAKESALVETYAKNGWVALAVAGGASAQAGAAWGTAGVHDNQADAEAAALANCAKKGATNCEVVRSLSSFDNAADIDGVRK
jgi:hypothetical protein